MKKTMMIAASLAVLAGCAKVESPQQEATQEGNGMHVITAFVKEDATKVAISSAGGGNFDHKWQATDKISLFDGTTNRPYTLTSGATTRQAEFTGAAISSSAPYYALYPYNEDASYNTETYKITTTFPAVQTYTANSYDPAALVMIAKSADANSFAFKLASSIIQITLAPTAAYTVKKVEITANGGESIAGEGEVSWNDGAPTVTMAASGVPTVTVSFGEGVALSAGTTYTFYVALPAVALTRGVSVAITGSDNKMLLKSSTTALTLTRNYVTKMPALTAVPNVTNLSLANSALVGLAATPQTANCYVMKVADTYAIPIDTKGNSSEITLKGITSVEELWDDEGTISNLKLYGKYLQFTATATNSNALLAAKVGEDIVWSWHIWTNTEYTLGAGDVTPTPVAGGFQTYTYMPLNLGAITRDDTDTFWKDGCWYQFGRKDPVSLKSTYSASGSGTATTDWSIKNPTTTNGSWKGGDDPEHAWNRNGKDEVNVLKAIYDPSPVGYAVAPGSALASIVYPGHGSWDNVNKATIWGDLYIPMAGILTGSTTSRPGSYGNTSAYLSATYCGSGSYAYSIWVLNDHSIPTYQQGNGANLFCIRSIRYN